MSKTKLDALEALLDDTNVAWSTIEKYIKENMVSEHLTSRFLGKIFKRYVSVSPETGKPETYRSRKVSMEELVAIHPDFKTTNGNTWARSQTSFLGREFEIEREKEGGKVVAIQLVGPSLAVDSNRSIKKEIRDALSNQRCAVLDTSQNIEVDHKNGRYDDERVADISTQSVDDFQPLSKAANDAKRQHCKVCKQKGVRYDAKRLGYAVSYLEGTSDAKDGCKGCYWYDPKSWNAKISAPFAELRD